MSRPQKATSILDSNNGCEHGERPRLLDSCKTNVTAEASTITQATTPPIWHFVLYRRRLTRCITGENDHTSGVSPTDIVPCPAALLAPPASPPGGIFAVSSLMASDGIASPPTGPGSTSLTCANRHATVCRLAMLLLLYYDM